MANGSLLGVACLVLLLDWPCSSSGQHLASAYRLSGQKPSDNVTVLHSDRKGGSMGPFANSFQESSSSHRHRQWNQKQQQTTAFQEDTDGADGRTRRDAGKGQRSNVVVEEKDDDTLLVQTHNGLLRGIRKVALGESVDVFYGVRVFFISPSRVYTVVAYNTVHYVTWVERPCPTSEQPLSGPADDSLDAHSRFLFLYKMNSLLM